MLGLAGIIYATTCRFVDYNKCENTAYCNWFEKVRDVREDCSCAKSPDIHITFAYITHCTE